MPRKEPMDMEQIERIAHRAAKCCTSRHMSFDETVQEGRVLAFRTLRYKPEASDAYLFAAVVRSLGTQVALAGLPFRVDAHDWRSAAALRKRCVGMNHLQGHPAEDDIEGVVGRAELQEKAAQRIAALLANDSEGAITLEMLRTGAGLAETVRGAGGGFAEARAAQKRVLRRLAKDDLLCALAEDLPS